MHCAKLMDATTARILACDLKSHLSPLKGSLKGILIMVTANQFMPSAWGSLTAVPKSSISLSEYLLIDQEETRSPRRTRSTAWLLLRARRTAGRAHLRYSRAHANPIVPKKYTSDGLALLAAAPTLFLVAEPVSLRQLKHNTWP